MCNKVFTCCLMNCVMLVGDFKMKGTLKKQYEIQDIEKFYWFELFLAFKNKYLTMWRNFVKSNGNQCIG